MGQYSQSHSRLVCARVNTWVSSGKTLTGHDKWLALFVASGD
jgi:hypothetical protein